MRSILINALYVSYRSPSHLLSRHELRVLLDEEMTDDERIELQLAEDVCRRFLACDLEAEGEMGAKQLLTQILGRDETVEDNEME